MTASQSPLSQATDDRLASMLFQGEEIEDELTVEGARVAVTTHRVLVFTPDREGRRFDHVDRPNVLGATVETTGQDSYVDWGVRSGVYGAVLLGGGLLLEVSGVLDEFEGAGAAEDVADSGISQVVSALPSALAALTTVLVAIGVLLVLGAAALVALYYTSREQELVIERAGRDPMRIPVHGEEGEQAARRLRTAVGTGSKSPSD